MARRLCARHLFRVTVADNTRELVRLAASALAAICVLLLPAPRKRGPVPEEFPQLNNGHTPVLLVETDAASDDWLLAGIEAGAVGALASPLHPRDVRHALELAGQGGAMLAPRTAALLIQRIRERHHEDGPLRGLTRTELRVAQLLARACSNKQIAEHLRISKSTVETHVSHVLKKLGVQSRSEAVLVIKPQKE
ncbi:MAG: response regulator transcription factor [Bryobacteraceae bacterium]|nr:response regulator transcription factor [Bryobacteraceae bacterium]